MVATAGSHDMDCIGSPLTVTSPNNVVSDSSSRLLFTSIKIEGCNGAPANADGRRRCRFDVVMLSGAFLAEAAATVDNKLNVSGGVLSKFMVGPDHLARFVLVLLTRADAEDSDRQVDVEIKPPTFDEPPQHRRFEVPEAALSEFPGFALFEIDVSLPIDGPWAIDVHGGGATISLPLEVSRWNPRPSLTN
jgi:hypothetical protein